MFEAIKITNSCNNFLKQFDIKISDDLHIYKKGIFIHCKVDDWRGPIEIDGFPVLIVNEAVCKIIELSIWEHFLKLEKNNRKQLIGNYLEEYGKYDPRKYVFEETLKILEKYDESFYKKIVKKYINYLNKNRNRQKRWKYNFEKEIFE